MKTLTILVFLFATSAYGFFGGLGNFSTETTQIAFKIQDIAQHAETIRKWERNYRKITQQLDTMTEQLDVQTTVKDWIGDPLDVELPAIEILSVDDFLNDLKHGIPWEDLIDEADGSDSLEETHDGLFVEIEATTVTGEPITVVDAELKKFAVVDQQYENYIDTAETIDERLSELQENQALTLEELEAATTDAEVQKLAAIVEAQNGQIALLISERNKQYQQYAALKQLSENQSEKTKTVSVKAQLQDQHDAFQSLQSYFGSITDSTE